MPIQRKNLFLTWGIRISLVPVILVLLALAAVSAIVAFLLSPYGAPQVLFWLGRKLLEFAGSLYDLYY